MTTMNEQLTSDELRQVLAEWIRPMYPKQRQKIAGLFEAVIARAEAAEAEAVDLHRQLAEMAAAMEEIEAERLALAARVAELEARAEAAEKLVAELKFERNAAARRAYNTEVDNQQLTAENRRLAARVAELEAAQAAQGLRRFEYD